ncbi:hypothetical protein ACVWW1_008722 [Bradyrhizobium sp. JR3.5]
MWIECEVPRLPPKGLGLWHPSSTAPGKLENVAPGCAMTGLALIQPAFLHVVPTELSDQSSQTRIAGEADRLWCNRWRLSSWSSGARSSAVGLAQALDDPDPLAESFKAALELGFDLEVSRGVAGRERLVKLLMAKGHGPVFRDFGLADSTRDPAWIRACDGFWHSLQAPRCRSSCQESDASQMAGSMQRRVSFSRGSDRNSCSGGRTGRNVTSARTYAPSYAQTHRKHMKSLTAQGSLSGRSRRLVNLTTPCLLLRDPSRRA